MRLFRSEPLRVGPFAGRAGLHGETSDERTFQTSFT